MEKRLLDAAQDGKWATFHPRNIDIDMWSGFSALAASA
jgi:hypothetical protein